MKDFKLERKEKKCKPEDGFWYGRLLVPSHSWAEEQALVWPLEKNEQHKQHYQQLKERIETEDKRSQKENEEIKLKKRQEHEATVLNMRR